MPTIKKTFEFSLDLKRKTDVELQGIVDGDTGNVFVIELTENGKPIDPALVDNARVILMVSTQMEGWASQDSALEGSGITIQNGVITVDLFVGTYHDGQNDAILEVYTTEESDFDTLVTTQTFSFYAWRGGQAGVEGSKDYPALIKAINDAYEAIAQIRYPIGVTRDAATQHMILLFSDGSTFDVGPLVNISGNASMGVNLLYNGRPHVNSMGNESASDTIWTAYRNEPGIIQLPTIIEGDSLRGTLPASTSQLLLCFRRKQYTELHQKINAGNSATLSFEIRLTNTASVSANLLASRGGTTADLFSDSIQITASNAYTRVAFSGTAPDGWDYLTAQPDEAYMSINVQLCSATNTAAETKVYIRNVKLETGEVATDWCASSKDQIDMLSGYVKLTEQTLTQEQKMTVRANIGLFQGGSAPADIIDHIDESDWYVHVQ